MDTIAIAASGHGVTVRIDTDTQLIQFNLSHAQTIALQDALVDILTGYDYTEKH